MHLLQVCNVGSALGGTTACAWTITRALPEHQHTVLFRTRPDEHAREVFAPVPIHQYPPFHPTTPPDAVILHNAHEDGRLAHIHAPTINYVHSRGRRATADLLLYCSHWCAHQNRPRGYDDQDVLIQAVPKPRRPEVTETRELRDHLTIGRICTPHRKKWPAESLDHIEQLAATFPAIRWEFVGCPPSLREHLTSICPGAAIHPSNWNARQLLWTWDALLYHNPRLTESFGRTAADAMRAGCIPIVQAAGGFLEQINPAVGFLCDQPADFANAIRAVGDLQRRRSLSRAAMAYADERFSLQRFAVDLKHQLDRAAQRFRAQ